MRIRASFFLLGLCAALPAGAVPSFEVLLSADFAQGHLSRDGSVATLSLASRSAAGNSGFSWVRRLDEPGGSFRLISAVDNIYNPVPSGDGSVVFAGSAHPEFHERWERTASTDFEYEEVPFAGSDRVTEANHDGSVYLFEGVRVTPTGSDTLGFRGTALSGSGDIVVGTQNPGLDTGTAVRWENGVIQPLGDLPGGLDRSFANDISLDDNTIVGFGTTDAGRQAMMWRNGALIPLGGVPGSTGSNAISVSGDGSVVVGSIDYSGDSEPFYWTEDGGMRDLRTLLEALGVDLPDGLELDFATQVSSDGRRILGTGSGPDTDEFGTPEKVIWLATIPEPMTGTLLGGGLVALGIAGRRRPRR